MSTATALTSLQKNNFLVLGRAGLDLYAEPPGTPIEMATGFSSALGGSAANIAVAIVKLGGKASLISAVSDDAVGRYTLRQMTNFGIESNFVERVTGEARNSLAVVETRSENCQSVIYRNGAADFELKSEFLDKIDFSKFGALIVTGTALAREPSRTTTQLAMSLARAAGLCVVIDVDYRPYSWPSAAEAADVCLKAAEKCDIVVGNDVEFSVMANGWDGLALAKSIAENPHKIVVYKMGEKGAVTFANGIRLETGIYPVVALKPTGAGDAFMGGFITSLANGLNVTAALQSGSGAAAIVVTKVGCAPAMPTAHELAQFLETHTQNEIVKS